MALTKEDKQEVMEIAKDVFIAHKEELSALLPIAIKEEIVKIYDIIDKTRTELFNLVDKTRTEFKEEIREIRKELNDTKKEVSNEISDVRKEISNVKSDVAELKGMMKVLITVGIGVFLTAVGMFIKSFF